MQSLTRFGLFILAALCSCSALAASPEYELKAAFISRFTEFIDWPGASDAGHPFRICVFGDHPIEETLNKLPALLKVKNRSIQIQRIQNPVEASQCEIAFIPRESARLMGAINHAVNKHPVLIVGEAPGQLQQGAVVNFLQEGDRLRFEINLTEAKNSGLNISSRLLKLASAVE